jgi:hypothetical protein
MAAKFAHSHAYANRTLGGIEAIPHQGQDQRAGETGHGCKHASRRIALLSTIQTDGMIFRLQRRRHPYRGRCAVLLNMTQLLKNMTSTECERLSCRHLMSENGTRAR